MFDGYGEVVVADEAPKAAEFRVAGDEGCEWCAGAFDEPYGEVIADLGGSGGHVVDENGQRRGEVVGCPIGAEGDELVELSPGVDRGEQCRRVRSRPGCWCVGRGRQGRAGELVVLVFTRRGLPSCPVPVGVDPDRAVRWWGGWR
jgi:hypothetical protein